jgi:UDP-glucose 4-epimerase
MRALVTGGMGFIGSHLCEHLLHNGHRVSVIDDLSSGSRDNIAHLEKNERLTCHVDTIRNKPLMEKLLDDCDVAFHLAAVVGVRTVLQEPLRCLDTNIRGTDMLMELASARGVKVMIASSSEVYGKTESEMMREEGNRLLGPTTVTRWIYATTKAVDEYLALGYAREKKLPVVVMRFFNTVGPRQTGRYGMVLPTFVQQALRGEPLTVYGDGRQVRCFTYVTDVTRAVLALAEHPQANGEIFNIGGKEPISIGDLALRVKRIVGSDSPLKHIPYDDAYGNNFEDPRARVPDITKLQTLLGYEPQTRLDDMIKNIVAYFRGRHQTSELTAGTALAFGVAPTSGG